MKTVLITGTTKGIGKELVIWFLDHGFKVITINRNPFEIVNSNSENLISIHFDLEDIDNFDSILNQIKSQKIDFLINNAAILIKKSFSLVTKEDLEKSLKINFLAPYFLIQKLLNSFSLNAHIVNISTIGAVQGSVKFPELTTYGTSKSALTNLTELLAVELEGKIKINCLALGAVQTEMLTTAFPDYKAPLNPNEMAEFIANFTISAHQFMNGKIVPVSLSTP